MAMRVSELLGIRRYRPEMRLRISPQRLLLQRLLDCGIMRSVTRENMLTINVRVLLRQRL